MEWIVIIGLGVALYQLWQRVEGLERRLTGADAAATRPDIVSARTARGEISSENPAGKEIPVEPAPLSVPPVRRAIARVTGMAVRPDAAALAPTQPESKTRAREQGRVSINFEELFGRQLPIWAGGITLAIAGFFLVMYAIDLGLLSPPVRVLLGFAFGGLLVQGAFLAERMKDKVRDVRVTQALAGAGIATLYACFYLAGQGYGLIGGGAAFLGLAAVTAGAIWLSFRFGLPCAVLGLVGGFAAPMLVSSNEANLPILSIYLALVSAGLTLTGNRQDRPWLGVAALVGGLIWGFALLVAQDLDMADQLFVGLYLIGIGIILPAGLGDLPHRRWLRVGAGAFAALQVAALLEGGGHTLLAWGLYTLLSGALAFLAWRSRELRDASAFASIVAIVLLVAWPSPRPGEFAIVSAALAAIFAGVPLAYAWARTARASDTVQLAFFAPALALAAAWHFGDLFGQVKPAIAIVALALAALPALAVWRAGEGGGWRVHLLEISAVLATVLGFAQVLHDDWGAAACGLAAIAMALALPRRVSAARTFAAIAAAFALYPFSEWAAGGLDALAGEPLFRSDLATWQDTMRYLMPAVAAGLVLAWRQLGIGAVRGAQAIGILAGVGAVIAAHSLFKEVFAIDAYADFERLGLAERTIWEAVLIAAALVAWQLRDLLAPAREAAIALCAAALAHFGWFTLAVHNPLWDGQAVGPMPVANLALAAYGAAIGGILLLRRLMPERGRSAFEAAIMALIPLLVLTLLRQVFSGSILTFAPMGQGEDLLRSLVGIVLAIAYLLWGARREDRLWRIGSLVLMLLAVGKVFLIDAAVLEGLARIASFMALGFSLIGIGWFYSRILARPSPTIQEGRAEVR